ncbi:MAG: aldose epimerase family protein [Candidatus Coproplasma sp.]
MITKALFDKYKGREVFLYTIENADVKVGVLNFGATLNFIRLNTPQGEKDVILGYDCVEGYIDGKSYAGATVGRVANRIAGAKFTLGGKEYRLSANEGVNCLHGGAEGFDKRFFEAEVDGDTLTLSLTSPDGDMGFPGELKLKVAFTLTGRELSIKYTAISDKDTLFSPTCHAYFNLNGEGDVMGNTLLINAFSYVPVDKDLLPFGVEDEVKGSPFDFTCEKAIGENYALLGGETYDCNLCLYGIYAATATGDKSGISMDLCTNLPGMQLYVGNLKPYKGRGGGQGFCLAPQFFPNAVNIEDFETPLLKANEEAVYTIKYEFKY